MTPTADEIHDYFFKEERTFIRVYRLPEKLTNGYCFGGGVPITFLNVDWCEHPIKDTREQLLAFLQTKMYIVEDAKYLVLSDHPDFTFRFTGRKP